MCDIGQRLREIRESTGQNQADFGERFGVSRNTQYYYEINKRPPDALYLVGLHEAGLDIGYILTGETRSDTLSPAETSLIHMFRRVDPERQEVVLATLRLMAPQI